MKWLVAAATVKQNFATVYHEAVFCCYATVELRSRATLRTASSHWSTVDNNYARFALLALLSPTPFSLRADVPDCCKKTAAGGVCIILSAVIALVCYVPSRRAGILFARRGDSGQT